MAFLCVKLIFSRKGYFSSQHIHDNPAMKKRGIKCVMEQDGDMRLKNSFAIEEKNK